MRRLLAILLLVFAPLAAPAASSASAAGPPAPAPAAPTGMPAGGERVVTPIPALPAGAREFELFLLPEDGKPIRLCAEQSAGTRQVAWRMPFVGARRARLMMRYGGPGGEWESSPSDWFDLAPLPGSELERVLQGRSEAGARFESSAGRAQGFGEGEEHAEFGPGRAPAAAVEAPAAPGIATFPRSMPAPAARECGTRTETRTRTHTSTPRHIPLRN